MKVLLNAAEVNTHELLAYDQKASKGLFSRNSNAMTLVPPIDNEKLKYKQTELDISLLSFETVCF